MLDVVSKRWRSRGFLRMPIQDLVRCATRLDESENADGENHRAQGRKDVSDGNEQRIFQELTSAQSDHHHRERRADVGQKRALSREESALGRQRIRDRNTRIVIAKHLST